MYGTKQWTRIFPPTSSISICWDYTRAFPLQVALFYFFIYFYFIMAGSHCLIFIIFFLSWQARIALVLPGRKGKQCRERWCVCVRVRVRVRVCVRVSLYVHVCKGIYVCIYVYICTCIFMCVMYTCNVCACTYSCIYTCIYLCRHNHLNPDISKEAWTHEEDLKLVEAHLVIQVFFWFFLSHFIQARRSPSGYSNFLFLFLFY
jgi:hypothetical protein